MSKQPTDQSRPKASRNSADTTKQHKTRRRLIQTLALGGGIASAKLVPVAWKTPRVQSVLLPAHAAGSVCVLGNLLPPELRAFLHEPAGPASVAEQVVDTFIPQAWADSPLRLTGCFRFEFVCNTNSGTLCYSVRQFTGDEPSDTEVCVEFTAGVCVEIEANFWVRLDLNGNESATLRFGPDCSSLNTSVNMVPNPSCVPDVEPL